MHGLPALNPTPSASGAARGVAQWVVAAAALAAGATVALAHPLAPLTALSALLIWAAVSWRWPRAWLWLLPAALPALNFSPWSGWIGLEELDLIVLGAAASGHARPALRPVAPSAPAPGRALVLVALWTLAILGPWRGVVDAGGWHFDAYQGYGEPLNAVRVGKSLVYALLLWPLLRSAWSESPERTFALFARGMVAGAAVLIAAVLWERAAMPGLLNISAPYRTVGLFWEMHVGGAAIDAYVVLCTPFVAWGLYTARQRWQWIGAAVLALLWGYACLTTFARGAYVGIAVGLFVLGLSLPRTEQPRRRGLWRPVAAGVGALLLLATVLHEWGHAAAMLATAALAVLLWLHWRRSVQGRGRRRLALGLLLLALLFEAVLIFGPDSFMTRRAADGARDYQSRRVHWARGLALLETPSQWIWGLGSGRLPAHYDRDVPGGEFPGEVRWVERGPGAAHVEITGPRSRPERGGLHGLTHRVAPQARYTVRLMVRSAAPARLLVRVCESHLLYLRYCQWTWFAVAPSSSPQWQSLEARLRGPALTNGPWFAPRQAVLTLSSFDAGSRIDVDEVSLAGTDGRPLLRNGDFDRGLAHWLPAAQSYFVPWHIDNLYLELLIERGALGALLLLGVLAVAGVRAVRQAAAGDTARAFVGASLAGVLALGLLSSVQDVPRVALLMALIVAFALQKVK